MVAALVADRVGVWLWVLPGRNGETASIEEQRQAGVTGMLNMAERSAEGAGAEFYRQKAEALRSSSFGTTGTQGLVEPAPPSGEVMIVDDAFCPECHRRWRVRATETGVSLEAPPTVVP
jgi:hypothetical protein